MFGWKLAENTAVRHELSIRTNIPLSLPSDTEPTHPNVSLATASYPIHACLRLLSKARVFTSAREDNDSADATSNISVVFRFLAKSLPQKSILRESSRNLKKERGERHTNTSFLHLQHTWLFLILPHFVEHLADALMRVPRDRHLGAFSEAPPGANRTGPTHVAAAGSNANFDTNMVIILAALLCALIFALGLNSIVRCALRCGRRMAFETPEEVAARLAATGLKRRALRRIPVAVYGEGADIPTATECPICLGEFADGEKVRVLPKCHHGFHVRCIDKWLASHSSCPTCRRSLLDQGAGEGAEAAGRAAWRTGLGTGEYGELALA